ncbi:hypothetical protein U14_04558 [Candidatus Moduliflexus flocculans]|uniref:Lipoprotein n=1 Tax=Candidatus Moduliflexus flocculans TaxID=1499966 RepID=A0A0S6W0R6_9BACT|nr:hypothetical protein U14_04558 [Candidatus Moduliflexus flocculans]
MKRFVVFYCCVIMFLGGCQFENNSPQATRSFYYWRTVFDLSAADLNYLRKLRVGKLYVKFFDVDWFDSAPRGAFPVAPVRFASKFPADMEIVPTVFLTNATVRRIPLNEIPTLAGQITQKIQRMAKAANLPPFREIQLDCDWTGATRAAYFTLLQAIIDLTQPQQIAISATIRLHQLKYDDSIGVPPVARGMLMCYNMASPKYAGARNAIFDLRSIDYYLDKFRGYPLPLDVALPLFSWGAVYRRERFIMLINNARTSDFDGRTEFERDEDGMFAAKQDAIIRGQDVFKGERVRVDEPRMDHAQRLAQYLAAQSGHAPVSVAWFHYDPNVVKYYAVSDIEQAYWPFDAIAFWREVWHGK